jgi:uncharacterized membrane protein YqhA
MSNPKPAKSKAQPMTLLAKVIFSSRWLQLPLYLGLIAAQAVYVYHFWVELLHLMEAAFGNQHALELLVKSIGYKDSVEVTGLNETIIMLVVLALIDVVMISNLLIMVIVGGYETFVSRMNLDDHPDQPEWLRPCECLGAQGQVGNGHHRHQLDPSAQDLYQRGQLRREGIALANPHPHYVPAVSSRHCLYRQADVASAS